MADLLKLKEGLQACIRLQKGEPVSCEVCPYNGGRMTCETMRAILEDALTLLEEREPVVPVKSDIVDFEEWAACGYCKSLLVYGNKYCSNCGHEVNWT